MCCIDLCSLLQSVKQWQGALSVYNKGVLAVSERMGRLVCSENVLNNAIYDPKYTYFCRCRFLILFGINYSILFSL